MDLLNTECEAVSDFLERILFNIDKGKRFPDDAVSNERRRDKGTLVENKIMWQIKVYFRDFQDSIVMQHQRLKMNLGIFICT